MLSFSLTSIFIFYRKSSFSKDSACRQAAVSALISLLRAKIILFDRENGSGSGNDRTVQARQFNRHNDTGTV